MPLGLFPVSVSLPTEMPGRYCPGCREEAGAHSPLEAILGSMSQVQIFTLAAQVPSLSPPAFFCLLHGIMMSTCLQRGFQRINSRSTQSGARAWKMLAPFHPPHPFPTEEIQTQNFVWLKITQKSQEGKPPKNLRWPSQIG